MQDQSLGQEGSLEKEMQLAPVFLPGKFHGKKSLSGYRPWSLKVLDMTEYKYNKPYFLGISDFSLA